MIEFLKMPDLLRRYSICRQTVRNWIAAGTFPKPTMTVGRRHYWRVDEVAAWESRDQNCRAA
jgi:predicted DNA-binding transcriptional regulator AlpA